MWLKISWLSKEKIVRCWWTPNSSNINLHKNQKSMPSSNWRRMVSMGLARINKCLSWLQVVINWWGYLQLIAENYCKLLSDMIIGFVVLLCIRLESIFTQPQTIKLSEFGTWISVRRRKDLKPMSTSFLQCVSTKSMELSPLLAMIPSWRYGIWSDPEKHHKWSFIKLWTFKHSR